MFVDKITLICKAGEGGRGCLSFRREAHVPRGGPDGGDGGDGGSIIVVANEHLNSLGHLAGHIHWNAERGRHGEGDLCRGKSGVDSFIEVPPGTIIRDAEHGHILKDLSEPGDQVVAARGGRGGRGNKRFATATNRAPKEFEMGQPGEERRIALELKVIADVGLIGKPNAGKSTLLSRLSRATPEIANYPFTTKHPNLGVVQIGWDHDFVLADIPGLIEGAHAGVGLGHEFLKHVERTRVLVHLVEPSPMDQTDPIDNYFLIREELRQYDMELDGRPEVLVVTKSELTDADATAELLEEATKKPVHRISSATGAGLEALKKAIMKTLQELDEST
ncbi:GTPase ObgE [Rubinisphaera brasiliensis]|uniref:GTPase Obg n=1 Tax=Rubinisphaera brasiliensis (strain ATCC 49424 / DSM 5305 / JCM 21570 / IAM 15109 / NBRC 103401 / IFAM 1448) TaxID=756272 RepID=F0SN67_RUBBR|nr:GTPase ObgE [Rubinisphaera brasiliensis]ADY61096.1 GTPase obg [Rubinisphaera brasiliensis DSM 5305]